MEGKKRKQYRDKFSANNHIWLFVNMDRTLQEVVSRVKHHSRHPIYGSPTLSEVM